MKTKLTIILFFLSLFNFSIAQDFRFGKVSKEELLEKAHPTDADANAAILYRETKTEFEYRNEDGWFIVTNYFERVKIYNKEGFDKANVTIDLYRRGSDMDKLSSLKGTTYFINDSGNMDDVKLRKDGIFDQETTKYLSQTKVTMPDVREGSIVEYSYTINSPFIFNIDEFKLQEEIPVNKVNVVFRSPEYFKYKTHQRGWVPFNLETSNKERKIYFHTRTRDLSSFSDMKSKSEKREMKFQEIEYQINLNDIPALKKEAFAGNISNYATAIQFEMSHTDFPGSPMKTYASTWEDVSKNIYDVDSFGPELMRTNYFEKDIDVLLSGVTTPEEKAERIFYYVQNKMSWNKYNGYFTNEGVKSAYKKEVGNVADINLMLIAMLRYADLNANPVLVSTRSHGIPLFPTRNGFNYVIAVVQFAQSAVLLDATNKDGEVGVLKTEIMNAQGRMILKDGQSNWISLRPVVPAVKNSMLSAQINPDFSVTGNSKNRFTGNYAFQYRGKYKGLNTDSKRKTLEKNATGTEMSNINFENLNTVGQPVLLDYDFESMDYLEDVAGKLYFSPMVFLATVENPFKPETRDYPIDFGFPMKDRYILNIKLPEGYNVESLPENVVYNLDKNMGSYRYLISQIGDILQLSVEFAINNSFITAEEYGNIKKFYELLIEKENEKVVLTKA